MQRALLTTLTLFIFAGCPSKPKTEAAPKPEATAASRAAPLSEPSKPEAPKPEPSKPEAPASLPMTVLFVDESRFAEGDEPYEVAVERSRKPTEDEAQSIVNAYFAGPTEAERARGLVALTHGLTGATVRVEEDTVRVLTEGACETNGAAYNVGSLLVKNVMQVDGIRSVKIYDPNGDTQEPEGAGHSIPECMEP